MNTKKYRKRFKTCIAVYVYPTEFDFCDAYFLDHLLLSANSSLIMSGAYCPIAEGGQELHRGIQVYEVDCFSGQYTPLAVNETPVTVFPLAEAKKLTLDVSAPASDEHE